MSGVLKTAIDDAEWEGIGGGGVKVEVTETVQWSEDPKGEETV